jgi:cation diffusion facilitator CzcD-associated flavoprotein CzcO
MTPCLVPADNRFRCKLEKVSPRSAGGWVVTYLNRSTNRQETLVTDYVVISTGLYAAPKVPEYKVSRESLHCDLF